MSALADDDLAWLEQEVLDAEAAMRYQDPGQWVGTMGNGDDEAAAEAKIAAADRARRLRRVLAALTVPK